MLRISKEHKSMQLLFFLYYIMESLCGSPREHMLFLVNHACLLHVFLVCSFKFDLRSWKTTCAKPPHTLSKNIKAWAWAKGLYIQGAHVFKR